MSPGLGDRLKKIAKNVNDAGRVIADADAVLHGRAPSSSFPSQPASGTGARAPAAPPAPANVRCAYCTGIVAQGTPKCPNCNAPL